MTRAEKIARAHELRTQHWTYEAIGVELGVSGPTVYRWVVPGAAERDRAMSAAWKAAHLEENRARDRANAAKRCVPCEDCDGPTYGAVCRDCRRARRDARWDQIEAMWADGLSMAVISGSLGMSYEHVGVDMAKMRATGRDLPYRHAGNADRYGRVAA